MQQEAKNILIEEINAVDARLTELTAQRDAITTMEERKSALDTAIKAVTACQKALKSALPPEPKEGAAEDLAGETTSALQ